MSVNPRDEFVKTWLNRRWKTSGAGAKWQNIRGFNVSVVRDFDDPSTWKWRLKSIDSDVEEFSSDLFDSEQFAKRDVLLKLAGKLGIGN
ncbi:hypothetical protein [Novipirellula rosea]|uniref:Uncharacterized protein n=1 Tax=Novipirellula rosea TaxID=1031540 RepID=A0ABP8N048_9BACT